MRVLTVNAGSSSLRAHLVEDGEVLDSAEVEEPPDTSEAQEGLSELLGRLSHVDRVAHRVVHGGPAVTSPTELTDDVRAALEQARSLAPLHLPKALALLDFLRARLPDTTHVVCPDTAFHRDLPEVARTYALPVSWREKWDLRRYGFHGLSFEWALGRAAGLLGKDRSGLQVVIAHLSGGCSVCAVREGRSVDTSMGLTPLEGLVMSKRSGTVDPGLLLWLLREGELTVDELENGLQRESGLVGLSDRSGDTRDLVGAGDSAARLAMGVFAHRARREIAAMAASLDRLDAVVFTGDIGWDQPEVPEAVCAGLPVLGLRGGLSVERARDGVVSSAGVPVVVVKSREELQLALAAASVGAGR